MKWSDMAWKFVKGDVLEDKEDSALKGSVTKINRKKKAYHFNFIDGRTYLMPKERLEKEYVKIRKVV
jgi:hypothetical protein